MKVRIRQAKAGRRYTQDNGVVIEIAANPVVLKESGKLVPYTNKTRGGVYGYCLMRDGTRIDKRELFENDEVVEDGRGEHKKSGDKTHQRGRLPRDWKIPWRGWGLENEDKMKSLVALVEERGFYLLRAENYFAVELNGLRVCVIFKSGNLGFVGEPQGPLKTFAVTTSPQGDYMPHRIALNIVCANNQWEELVATFDRFLEANSNEIIKRRKVWL